MLIEIPSVCKPSRALAAIDVVIVAILSAIEETLLTGTGKFWVVRARKQCVFRVFSRDLNVELLGKTLVPPPASDIGQYLGKFLPKCLGR